MSDWILDLRRALDAEYGDRPRIATLATVDRDGRPHGRSIVCRHIEDSGALWIATDARSAKNGQVRHEPSAELVFWLPTRREQFRVHGVVEILVSTDDDPRRSILWRMLSDATRAMFFWPPPGRPLEPNPSDFPQAVPAEVEPPDDFEVLIVDPLRVEHLDLKPNPHARRRWRAERDWEEELLNP